IHNSKRDHMINLGLHLHLPQSPSIVLSDEVFDQHFEIDDPYDLGFAQSFEEHASNQAWRVVGMDRLVVREKLMELEELDELVVLPLLDLGLP
ncbi:hypothetical protein PIB30_064332, partial [Stylosanthes scabra]|nr:hypothetical protein [Stylosanthes scabra]